MNINIMELPDWLGSDDLSLEVNPYLSLIKKVFGINDEIFNDEIERKINSNMFSDSERVILKNLIETNDLTKNSLLISAIQSNCPIDKITKLISWFDFEKLTGVILDKSGWEVSLNFRYFGEGGQNINRSRFEVDVFAWKKPFVLLIDNKRHAKTSPSYLNDAIEKQKKRLYELFEMIPIIHELPEMTWTKKWEKALLVPLIVTWKDHEIIDINNTPIVSSKSLRDVITNFRYYFDKKSWFHLIWEPI